MCRKRIQITHASEVYNVVVGGRISLDQLYGTLRDLLVERHPGLPIAPPIHKDFRVGDIRHSQVNISKAGGAFDYAPPHDLHARLSDALPWYDSRQSTAPIGGGKARDVRGEA